jgi:serine/threonine protein kinase
MGIFYLFFYLLLACVFFLLLVISPEVAKAIANQNLMALKAAHAMDTWALGVIMVELFTSKQMLRSNNPDSMRQLQSYEEISVPPSMIDDIQAQHLLSKMLRRNPFERANITTTLVSDRYFQNSIIVWSLVQFPILLFAFIWICVVPFFQRHAYLVGGLDTEQLQSAFHFLEDSQNAVKHDLDVISKRLKKNK